MANLTIRQLRYLEALARHGHFGRAAEECSISQPAMSMQIKAFEEELGAELFERGGRQARLTSFGEEVALRARDIVRAVDELEDFARASRHGMAGRLRIGVIPTVAPYLLPGLLARLKEAYGGLDIHIRETLTPKLIQELNEGRLDLAIVAIPATEASLTETPLLTEPFVLVRPRKDAAEPPPGRDELRDMRVLLLEEGHCFRDQALSFCQGAPALPARDILDASSLSTLVQMVDAGMGVTLIPEMAIAVETRSAAVSIVRFKDPQPRRTIGMVWRKTNPLAKQFAELCDTVRQSVAAPQARREPRDADATLKAIGTRRGPVP
jgi:LysR family hydrogen peroxide-inducible transcriptional activator